jgi:hypothetical protein
VAIQCNPEVQRQKKLAHTAVMNALRARLRQNHTWPSLRKARAEGLGNLARRYWLWRQVLKTDPVETDPVGRRHVELHLLCHWKDYLPGLWTLKSFLALAGDIPCRHSHPRQNAFQSSSLP